MMEKEKIYHNHIISKYKCHRKNATPAGKSPCNINYSTICFSGKLSNIHTRLQYPFYFKHLRVLVLGNEVAKMKRAIREILDGLNRDFAIK